MSSTVAGIFSAIEKSLEGNRIHIGELFDCLNSRGFGPILLVPALLVIFLGALPGACLIFGGIIFFASLQIFLGKDKPWIPQWLRRQSFRSKKFGGMIRKIKPFCVKADRYIQSRAAILARNEVVVRVTAFVSMVLAAGIITLSLVPFVPAILSLPVVFFALGLMAHDGILIAGGYTILVCSGFFVAELAGAD